MRWYCTKQCRNQQNNVIYRYIYSICMGFGCNAAGVVGCRIIDSPRERLIAVITNSFVPCNGRFPTLIAIITMFFVAEETGGSFKAAFMLTGVILLGIGLTFLVSWILSVTFLKGVPSFFALELPPYRRPQIGKVIVRSVFDRTMFVLGRAVLAAVPAGLLIWLLANCRVNNTTILSYLSDILDMPGRIMGMDGVILLAFLLGFPANEIVVPIMIMAYLSQGNLIEINDMNVLKQLLTDNGWTWATAVSAMLFTLVHWPCATTCLSIHKETGSLKWTLLSFLLPAILGCTICILFNSIINLL